ncbi:uncharacterized protein [Musca autumnalis]|uniref:uncharacterized protein n=1 Tax=Musca autumnalis TaxID=221902 RepID=UPI003CF3AAD6
MLLLMQNLMRRSEWTKLRTVALWCFTFLMIETSSIVVARPMVQATLSNLTMATVLSFCPVTISLALALRHRLEIEYESTYLVMWTVKYFLLTSISVPMVLAFDNVYVQISISLTLVFFISIFTILWGYSLASLLFCRTESSYVLYYITLAYLLFMSLFVNALVFFIKIQKLNAN